jgi:CheY-like chemotaxis protein
MPGFEVLEAEDGRKAMEIVNHRLGLVLTDIQMPGGIDGNTIAEKARVAISIGLEWRIPPARRCKQERDFQRYR